MTAPFGTKAGWNEWKEERDSGLRDPYSWLSLVELEWLDEDPRELNHFPGSWFAKDDKVTVIAPSSSESPQLFRDGTLIEKSATIDVVRGESDRSISDSDGREIEVAYRFWGPCVRVRDPHAKRLELFEQSGGLDRYDFDPSWVLRGRIIPRGAVEEIEVGSAIEGGTQIMPTWANAELALPGDGTVTLMLRGEGPEESSVVFHDHTNGDTTPGWRYAPAVIDGETVVVDFNRASIFPAHLSPFGTCPKPPEGNRIDMRVEAGEKTFAGRDTE